MSPRQRKLFRRDRSVGFLASMGLHGCFLLVGGLVFAKPIEFAVESGTGGLEISLLAAPVDKAESMLLPQHDIEETKLPEQERKETSKAEAVPGSDATTFHSAGGALTEAKPNYLKNPAPPYPRAARDNGWEGLVVLRVAVDKAGRAVLVETEQGSGHDVLDESARKAVRQWKFRPARLGTLPVDSTVRVPVRFKLET